MIEFSKRKIMKSNKKNGITTETIMFIGVIAMIMSFFIFFRHIYQDTELMEQWNGGSCPVCSSEYQYKGLVNRIWPLKDMDVYECEQGHVYLSTSDKYGFDKKEKEDAINWNNGTCPDCNEPWQYDGEYKNSDKKGFNYKCKNKHLIVLNEHHGPVQQKEKEHLIDIDINELPE